MQELRQWCMTYAPTQADKFVKGQELHKINGELGYRFFKSKSLTFRSVETLTLYAFSARLHLVEQRQICEVE